MQGKSLHMAVSPESQTHPLCALDEMPVASAREVTLSTASGMRYLVLFRVADGVRAYLNCCPHQGRSLSYAPDQFLFDKDGRLVCPHHGACFEPDSGHCVSGPCQGANLTPVATRVVDGQVLLAEPLPN